MSNTAALRSVLYHYTAKESRNTKNRKYGNGFLEGFRGIAFLTKQLLMQYHSSDVNRNNVLSHMSSFGIYTSPQNHVRIVLNKKVSDTFYIGKGEIHRIVNVRLVWSDIIQAYALSKRKGAVFFESLALLFELKAINKFLSGFNKNQTIYVSNFVDRYAYLYSLVAKDRGFAIHAIPHGRLMSFPVDLKYDVDVLYAFDVDDSKAFASYARCKVVELQEDAGLNALVSGAKGQVAYLSSASKVFLNYRFLFRLLIQSSKPVAVYPHPRERKLFYKILNTCNFITLPSSKYYDFDIVFGRLSTLTKEINLLNTNVVFLNHEERDQFDFPNDAIIIPTNAALVDFKEHL